jgi:hypothetical protein
MLRMDNCVSLELPKALKIIPIIINLTDVQMSRVA